MADSLASHDVPPLVGIYGIFSDKNQVMFVKRNHLWRQSKYSQPVDLLVCIKSPSKRKCREKKDAE
jgi:hypothetical protein